MQDTRPAGTPAPLLPDDDAWRRLAACLERRASALREPVEVARQHFQRAEILVHELRDEDGAQAAYEAVLEAWPAHLPAIVALRDLAVGRDDPALAAEIFARLEDLVRLGLDPRDRAELCQSFLLLWLFRWRDAARAGRAAVLVEPTEGGPELLTLLEPLLADPAHKRFRLEARIARMGDAESRRRLGVFLLDELGEREAGLDALAQAAPDDAAACWRLLEEAVAREDHAATAEWLEALTAFVPGTVAAALRFLAAEIWELRLAEPLRADLLYGQSRGGTLHAVIGLKRVLAAVVEGPQPLMRRLSEESEQLGEVGLDRLFAARALALAASRGDEALTERVARQVLARYPDETDAAELVERLCWQTRRWPALAEEWTRHRMPDSPGPGARNVLPDRTLRLALGALHEHARFDPEAALASLVRRTATGAPRVERDVGLLRALQRLAVKAAAPERVRAWQFEADVTEQAERRADLFLKIGRTLLRHTTEHEKALTYLFWVLDLQPENLTALRLIEGVCRVRGSFKPLGEILARELPLIDRPEERFPLARELAALHERHEGDLDRAIERLQEALSDQPGDAATSHDLARLYERTQRFSDLRSHLEDRLRARITPVERAETHLRLGELAERHFLNPEAARAQYEQATMAARLPGAPAGVRRAAEHGLARLTAVAVAEPASSRPPSAGERPVEPEAEADPSVQAALESLPAIEIDVDLELELDPGGEPATAAGPPTEDTVHTAAEATRVDDAVGPPPTAKAAVPLPLPALPRLPTPGGRSVPPGGGSAEGTLRPLPTPSPALRASAAPGAGSLPPLPRLPTRTTPPSLPGVAAAEAGAVAERPTPRPATPRWQAGEEVARAPEADPARAVVARKLRRARDGADAPEAADPWPDFGEAALASAARALNEAPDADARAEAAAALARAYESLGQVAAAVRAWRAVLAWRAGDATAEEHLARSLPAIGDLAGLAELRARQAERTADPARRDALRLEAAELYLGALADPAGALPVFRTMTESDAEAGLPATLALGERLALALAAAGAFVPLREVQERLQRRAPTPERAGALGRLLLHRLNQPDDALPHLEAAAEALPEFRADLAVCRAAQGEIDQALRMLADGALEASGRPSVKLHLARMLERRGVEPEQVRSLYVAALEAGERDPELLDRVEQLAVAQKDWALLARVVEAQRAAVPADRPEEVRDLAVRLGHLYYKRLDRPLDAARVFLEAWRLQPTDLSLYRVIEGILARSPDPGLHIALYETFLEQSRTTTRERVATALKLAGLLEQAGRFEDACRWLTALPPAPEVTATLERLYPRAEKWAELATLLRARLEQEPDDPVPLLRRLAQTLESGLRDLPGATDVWRALLERAPEDLATVRALCRLLEAQKRWPELVEISERELALSPERRQQAYVLFRIGSVQETQLGQLDAAARNYHRALELDARCFPALHGLRELAAAAGQWVTVIQSLAREAELWDEPRERASVLARIAEIHEIHLRDPEAALHHYRRAVGLYPACLPAVRALAADAVRREAWEEAAPHLQVLSNQNLDKWPRPQRAEVFVQRGLVALRLGRTIEATECLKIALELHPDHLDALALLVESAGRARAEGVAEEMLGRLAQAEAGAREKDDLPRRARIGALRGQVHAQRLEIDVAERCFAEAAHLCPDDLSLLRPLVELYIAGRRWPEATRALRAFSDRTGSRPDAEPALIEALLWEAGIWTDFAVEPARALECLRRVLHLDDGHREALFQMAQCQYLQGRYHDARESMTLLSAIAEEAADPAPERARYRFYLGRIQQVGFQAFAAAVEHYRAAVELDPACAPASLALLRLWEGQGDTATVDAYLASHPDILQLPDRPERASGLLLAFVARIRQDRGDRAGAKAVLQTLTEREGPTTRDARFALVRLSQGHASPAESTEHLTRILDRDICDVEALRALAGLVERHGDEERLYPVLGALELLRALTAEEEARFQALRERVRRALDRGVRPVPEALLVQHLHHPAFESPIVSIIGPLDPALARQFGARLLPSHVRKPDRLFSAAELKLVQGLCGTRQFELVWSSDVADVVALVPGDRPTVVLGEAAGADEVGPLHRRFAVARAVALARYGLARVHDIDTERAVELLRVLEGLFTPSADGSEREHERDLLDALPRKVVEQLRPEIERRRQGTLPALYTGESALIGVMRTADRFGLIACGELRPAIEHLARSGGALDVPPGADLTWAVRGRARLQDLVKYALSESHHLLRRAIGVGI
jgi:tetratricopeptide (TPR) repeat protein